MKISRIREFKNFCLAATIFVAGASLASCSSSDDIAENNQQPVENPSAPKVYTMTIQASKGDGATTRGLSLDKTVTPHKLNATWNAGEEVLVYQSDSKIGTLTATASTDASTTLSGTLDPALDPNQALTFYFHTAAAPSYSGQDGTLATIASTYDFCEAATVTTGNFTVNTSDNTVNVPAGISFGANQQAIVKFTLIDKADGTTLLNAKSLVVNDGTTNYTITPASATSEIYVAIPGISDKKVTLTATVGSDTYTYEKSGVTFTNGQYYEINVKMLKTKSINDGSVEVPAGEHWLITGTGSETTNQITIRNGATVTLAGVKIIRDSRGNVDSYCIKCDGNATIILKDGSTNTLTSLSGDMAVEYDYPALWAGNKVGNDVVTLTIKGETAGTGALTVQSGTNSYCAGIGSGRGENDACGHIMIEGGDITATGGAFAAGIGSGGGGTCGNITIKGGTIEATGGNWAAGIGSGDGGTCGTITIASTVSSVTATGGDKAPNSIGAGAGASCGTVTFGNKVMYNGSAWDWGTTPVNGTYGGLNFAVSTKTIGDDTFFTWTLTPPAP